LVLVITIFTVTDEAPTGGALFDGFLRDQGISNRAAGKALFTTAITIRAWRKQIARPNSDDKRLAIEIFTAGAVPRDSWLKPSERLTREHLEQVRPFEADRPPPSAAE
jgi:hypothetical protein